MNEPSTLPPPPMTATEAKAQAKAAKAHAKALRPWYRKKRWWVLAVVAVIVVASIASSGGSDDKSNLDTVTNQPTGEAADVKLSTCTVDTTLTDFVTVEGTIHNNSSKRSDYAIELVYNNPDGSRAGQGFAYETNIEAGQDASWKTSIFGSGVMAGGQCKIVKVNRSMSL